ncbi:MAG: ABC transporter substrate-binding protein [Actinomycetota bacterium]
MVRRRGAAIALVIAFVIAACGTSSPDSTGPDSTSPDSTSLDSTTSTTTTEAPAPTVPPVEFPLTITDALGREHTIDGPARLGCVTSRCREILGGFGVAPAASPYEPSDFYFPVGPPEYEVSDVADLEAWSGANIDFAVFGGVPAPPASYALVEQFVTIFYVHTPGQTNTDGMDGIEAAIWNTRALGQLLDMNVEAEAEIARLEQAIATASTFSTPERATRSFVSLANDPGYREDGTTSTSEPGSFCTLLIEVGLGECIELPTEDREMSAEAFLALDPDLIVMHDGVDSVATRSDPTWQRLSAVQNGTAFDGQGNGYRTIGVRSMIWTLQEFIHLTVPDSGIDHPGPLDRFDPTTSPLVLKD